MRDIVVTQKRPDAEDPREWTIDIDVIDGFPTFLKEPSMSMDQRAALASVMSKGTIPGKQSIGIEWSSLYSNDTSKGWIDIDNQVKQNIQDYVSDPDDTGSNKTGKYYPIFAENDGVISIQVINTGAMSNGRN